MSIHVFPQKSGAVDADRPARLVLDVRQALFEQTADVRVVQAVVHVLALAPEAYQALRPHVAQRVGDGRLLHLQRGSQVGDAELPLRQQRDDAQARRIAE